MVHGSLKWRLLMWIFNSCGFFSVVAKPEDQGAGKLTI
jgi:hypothetical protein